MASSVKPLFQMTASNALCEITEPNTIVTGESGKINYPSCVTII